MSHNHSHPSQLAQCLFPPFILFGFVLLPLVDMLSESVFTCEHILFVEHIQFSNQSAFMLSLFYFILSSHTHLHPPTTPYTHRGAYTSVWHWPLIKTFRWLHLAPNPEQLFVEVGPAQCPHLGGLSSFPLTLQKCIAWVLGEFLSTNCSFRRVNICE